MVTRRLLRGLTGFEFALGCAFAIPGGAELVFRMLETARTFLDLPGDTRPADGPVEALFVAMFGCMIALWAAVRLLVPSARLILADLVARVPVSLCLIRAIVTGASPVLAGFLVLEVAGGILEAVALHRARGGRYSLS